MFKNNKNKRVAHSATPSYIIWQISIWDNFAKMSPFILATTIGILYGYGFRDWELFFDTTLIMLGIVIVCWWFWVLYTIAIILYVLEKSSIGLEQVMKDIHAVRSEIKDLIKPRNN